MSELIDKIKSTKKAPIDGKVPDKDAYTRWNYLLKPSTNALNTAEETIFFTIVIILFFAVAFFIIYTLIHLIRVFKNLDGSLYQGKHIFGKIILILLLIALDGYLLNYILVVSKII